MKVFSRLLWRAALIADNGTGYSFKFIYLYDRPYHIYLSKTVQSTPGMGCGVLITNRSVVAVESSKSDIKTQIGFDNYKHS